MSVNFKDLKSEKGMTLIELIIVVVILFMLIAALGWTLTGKINPAKEKIAGIAIADIGGALDLYMVELGNYPNDGAGLAALLQNTGGSAAWNGPYLKKEPTDPWGKPYIYRFPSQHSLDYDLCSDGADSIEGTDDDICNWK